jgi:hypothetical protein
MEKKPASAVSEVLFALILAALICSHEIEPYAKQEHTPETPYSAPDFSLRPIVTAVTTSATFTIPWRKL